MEDDEELNSGPYCKHWGDPTDCDIQCVCGHQCSKHAAGESCSECDCEEFKEVKLMDIKEFSAKQAALATEATRAGMNGADMFFAIQFGAIVVLETTTAIRDKRFFLEMAESVYNKREQANNAAVMS